MTAHEQLKFLRSRGCRCPLMLNGDKDPRPYPECHLPFGDKKQCWFIDSLHFEKQKEVDKMMRDAPACRDCRKPTVSFDEIGPICIDCALIEALKAGL